MVSNPFPVIGVPYSKMYPAVSRSIMPWFITVALFSMCNVSFIDFILIVVPLLIVNEFPFFTVI